MRKKTKEEEEKEKQEILDTIKRIGLRIKENTLNKQLEDKGEQIGFDIEGQVNIKNKERKHHKIYVKKNKSENSHQTTLDLNIRPEKIIKDINSKINDALTISQQKEEIRDDKNRKEKLKKIKERIQRKLTILRK